MNAGVNGVRIYEDNDPAIIYSSPLDWESDFNRMYHGSRIARTRVIGAWAAFKFQGKSLPTYTGL